MAEASHNVTSRRRLVMTGFVSGALASTTDGLAHFIVPVAEAHVHAIVWGLDVGGTTSGSTGITVKRVRAETDTAIVSDTNEDTIAHDASTLYSTIQSTLSATYKHVVLGDIVRIDLDTVTGGTDSAGFAAALILHVVRD
jgi:hypothetical protein